MGRHSLELSTFRQAYLEARKRGSDYDSASAQARAAVDAALEQRKVRRRETKRDSASMRRQLLGADHSEPGEAPSKKKSIVVWLDESRVAILNAEARRLAEDLSPGGDLPIEYWRSVVIAKLLTPLSSDNRGHEKRTETVTAPQTPVAVVDEQREMTIAALQDIIAGERKRGVPDADIQREVDKSYLGMTIDEILNYQFKTGGPRH